MKAKPKRIDILVTRTPDPDEKQDLHEWFLFAEVVIALANQIPKRQWARYGDLMDSIPTVGDYFRYRLATSTKFD